MEKVIKQWFPYLRNDNNFKVTSPCTDGYNCISWAAQKQVWYWPPLGKELEEDEYWPEGIEDDTRIETFIKAMETENFSICTNDNVEPNITKIALYAKNGQCTHAARQLSNGLWTSKLGYYHDIQHSTPQSLEGELYGKVYCYMNKE